MTIHGTGFFSISSELIATGEPAYYDLYINSSGIDARQHFVRVFPMGQLIQDSDVKTLLERYHQLYAAESQRSLYLKSITHSPRFSEVRKTEIIKHAAIQHLDNLFHPKKPFTTELLNESIVACRDTVEAMVDVVQAHDVEGLQKHIAALSFHDFYTYDHSINVSMYCIAILNAIDPNASRDHLITAGMGGLLHDLGKIEIPTHLLNKAGKLTDEEFGIIKTHSSLGLKILSEKGVETPPTVSIDEVRRVVHEHHENFDGTGYPQKLAGPNIHFLARLTAIADFFDAITTKRSYHEALSIDEALGLMSKTKGKKIDPKLFNQFFEHIKNLHHEKMPVYPGFIDSTFDPCQPHTSLPIHNVQAQIKAKIVNSGKKFDTQHFKPSAATNKIVKAKK